MQRTACVYCTGPLTPLYTCPSVPSTCAPTSNPPETDFVCDLCVGVCPACGCVQLTTLADPSHLYAVPHNATASTPTWREHHRAFADFVQAQDVHTLTEIGGSSGSLYQHLRRDIDYTCLDLCAPSDTSIPYRQANCETYDFTGTDCICMSHVFEHLYDPRAFVEHIAPHVRLVLLSIPDMNHLLSIRSSSIVFFEHTYFVDGPFLVWLFGQFGYRLRASADYRTHSKFLAFERGVVSPPPLVPRPSLASTMVDVYSDMVERCSALSIPASAFVAPAGHMGQLVYTLARPPAFAGFLDNDPTKQGRRMYGTPGYVFPVSHIASQSNPCVYVYAGVYTDELCAQLRAQNPSVLIHRV